MEVAEICAGGPQIKEIEKLNTDPAQATNKGKKPRGAVEKHVLGVDIGSTETHISSAGCLYTGRPALVPRADPGYQNSRLREWSAMDPFLSVVALESYRSS